MPRCRNAVNWHNHQNEMPSFHVMERGKNSSSFSFTFENISIWKIPTPNEFEKWAVSSDTWSGEVNANIRANKHPNNVTNQHFQKRNDLTFDVNLWPQLQMEFLQFNRIYRHSSSLVSVQSITNAKWSDFW